MISCRVCKDLVLIGAYSHICGTLMTGDFCFLQEKSLARRRIWSQPSETFKGHCRGLCRERGEGWVRTPQSFHFIIKYALIISHAQVLRDLLANRNENSRNRRREQDSLCAKAQRDERRTRHTLQGGGQESETSQALFRIPHGDSTDDIIDRPRSSRADTNGPLEKQRLSWTSPRPK